MNTHDSSATLVDTDFDIIFRNEIFDLASILDDNQRACMVSHGFNSEMSNPYPIKSQVAKIEHIPAQFDLAGHMTEDLSFLDDFIDTAILMDNSMHSMQTTNEFILNIDDKSFDEVSSTTHSNRSSGDAYLDLEKDDYDSSEDIVGLTQNSGDRGVTFSKSKLSIFFFCSAIKNPLASN
jgi:hypothetical protein